MAKITEMDAKAQMLRDMRSHQAKWIAPHSIVRLDDGRVGYLEKNTGGKPWVIVDPGELGVEIDHHERLEVLVTPCEMALDWMAQLDVYGPSTYRDATSDLLAACKLALSDCKMAIGGQWTPDADGFRATAEALQTAITSFEGCRNSDATQGLLIGCKLALSDCKEMISHLSWLDDLDGARDTAEMLRRIITKFERTRK